MKKIHFLFFVFLFTVAMSFEASAQENNFFVGQWKVLVKDTPKGDNTMIVEIDENDDKFSGRMLDVNGEKETGKFTKVEVKNDSITLHFTTQGFEAYLFLEKKDQDNVEGSLLDMFDAMGTRVVKK